MKNLHLTLVALVIGTASPLPAAEATPVPLSEIGKKLEANYTTILGQLRTELAAKLPDPAKVDAVNAFLSSDALDAKLAKYVVLYEATPHGLAEFAQQDKEQAALVDQLLADTDLMKRMLVADGASEGKYGRAMQIYSDIRKASDKASGGVLERLALAVGLEHAVPVSQENPKALTNAPATIDPLKRYLHFEKAFLNRELDPAFESLSVWELRHVVTAPESDEALTWGREMLRNFRPDHIHTQDEGWRYANLVNTDVRYGSIDVRNDRPELSNVQNILMNGGICGRRAFFARYICRTFGIPATARPSTGHGASARWSPKGWVVVLGPNWGSGSTTTRYGNDLDFLATTQARTQPDEFLKVKRAYWAGDVMGETRSYGEHDNKIAPALWNGIALATQMRIIEASKAVALDALGAELGEANGPTVAEKVASTAITPEDRKITLGKDGTITIPAAAYAPTEDNADDVLAMKSSDGGQQVFLPRFLQQKPILVRGGSLRHEASHCESTTRHWNGRRPKKSSDLRGLRLAFTPDDAEPQTKPQKELMLDLGDGVAMEFVFIPPGKFTMGGDRNAKENEVLADTPKHEVTLTKGFYLGKYEVTQAQYQAIMGKQQGNLGKGSDFPVDGVKPFNALLFCDELSAKIGLEVRLPTEAEWEYAARAGSDTRWFFGDDTSQLGEYAWFKDNAGGKSHPVGQKKPNPWGLHDMYGNIAEYVRDEHQEGYYAQGPKTDPAGPLLGIHSNMEYTINVPKSGDYTLAAQVVTSNVNQSLQLAVNGAKTAVNIPMPFTVGMWQESQPVTLSLKEGTNTLNFWRDQAPQYGVAVKSFTLRPLR